MMGNNTVGIHDRPVNVLRGDVNEHERAAVAHEFMNNGQSILSSYVKARTAA